MGFYTCYLIEGLDDIRRGLARFKVERQSVRACLKERKDGVGGRPGWRRGWAARD